MSTIGHNRGPVFDEAKRQELAGAANEFAATWKEWAGVEITADNAERLNDYFAGARKLIAKVEAQRKADKEPFLDAGRQVDAAYAAIKAVLDKVVESARAKLSEHARKVAAAEEAKRQAELAAARKAAEEAAKAATEAQDAIAKAEAEQAQADALKAALEAETAKTTGAIQSDSGMGRTAALRTYYHAEIADPIKALTWAYRTNRGELEAIILRLANAAKRADKAAEIPGVRFREERKIA